MSVQRRVIDLPSGGQWSINLNPKWREIKGLGAGDEPTNIVVRITLDWSFSTKPSLEAVEELDAADVMTVLRVFTEEVLPKLGGRIVTPNGASPASLMPVPSKAN